MERNSVEIGSSLGGASSTAVLGWNLPAEAIAKEAVDRLGCEFLVVNLDGVVARRKGLSVVEMWMDVLVLMLLNNRRGCRDRGDDRAARPVSPRSRWRPHFGLV